MTILHEQLKVKKLLMHAEFTRQIKKRIVQNVNSETNTIVCARSVSKENDNSSDLLVILLSCFQRFEKHSTLTAVG